LEQFQNDRKSLIPKQMEGQKEPTILPLEAYMGIYSNPGYGQYIVRPIATEAHKYKAIPGAEAFYNRIEGEQPTGLAPPTDSSSLVVDVGCRYFNFSAITLRHAGRNEWLGTATFVWKSRFAKPSRLTYETSNGYALAFDVQDGRVKSFGIYGIAGWNQLGCEMPAEPDVVFTKQE
jgi:hypothetical protein